MRKTGSSGGLTALAVAGGYVVVLGWDMSKQDIEAKTVLGFAVRRTRASDGEAIWLGGMKTFRSVEPNPDPGVPVSSYRHPLQTFQWSDYSVEPSESYTYDVVARGGPPGALMDVASVSLAVTAERVDLGKHAIFFNRGSIASQEYARRFQNRKPSEVGQAAYDWLSRGLIESLERFIGQAQAGDALNGAFFEFKNRRIYAALKGAKGRGVAVKPFISCSGVLYRSCRYCAAAWAWWFNAILDDLVPHPDSTEAFEQAWADLGRHLGFAAERPERELGNGPDDLWARGGLRYLIAECKSGTTTADAIARKDVEQLSHSVDWFIERYDATCTAVPLLIHRYRTVASDASPRQGARILTFERLAELAEAVRTFARSLTAHGAMSDTDVIAARLLFHHLTSNTFVTYWTNELRST